jgi:transcriptional regulator with XRE-family HTH domain
MGSRKIELGQTGRTVAKQVKRTRERNGLTVQQLSKRVKAVGRPILPSGITKIELGMRRVDVDDLVALAAALDAIPNDLLYEPRVAPPGISQEAYERLVGAVIHASDPNWYDRVTTDNVGLTDAALLEQQDTDG